MKYSWVTVAPIVVLGLVGGALSGLLGIGSGIIMVPVLSALWSHDPDGQKLAQGTALAAMVPMTIVGALSYHFGGQQGNWRLAVPLIVWGLVIGLLALAVPLRCGSLLCVTHTLGLVRWETVAILAVGAVIGSAMLGAPLAAALPAPTLKTFFGIFLILVGLRMAGVFAWIGTTIAHKPV